jgi:translation initiation factor IF-2
VATVLVQEGTLKVGDSFVCGTEYGRIRAMMDDKGRRVTDAGPSTPVEIQGLGGVPSAGDVLVSVQDEQKARQVAEHRHGTQRDADMGQTAKVSLDELYQQIQTGDVKELKVVLKADVQGALEASARPSQALDRDVRLPSSTARSVHHRMDAARLGLNAIIIGSRPARAEGRGAGEGSTCAPTSSTRRSPKCATRCSACSSPPRASRCSAGRKCDRRSPYPASGPLRAVS